MEKKIGSYAVAIIIPIIILFGASQITIEGNIKRVNARKMAHPALGMEDCLSCHNDTEPGYPPNHYQYTTNICITCHKP
jgi:hypothetical protein